MDALTRRKGLTEEDERPRVKRETREIDVTLPTCKIDSACCSLTRIVGG